MAYLVRKPGERIEIREAIATEAGPRARTLASFRGALTPEVLDRAERRASRGLDRMRIADRARSLGLRVVDRREDRTARALLAELRAGGSIDPVLVGLLRDALAELPAEAAPEALSEVAEWIGADDARRGEALRGLLRVSDRIVTSRAKAKARPRRRFPRFRSRGRKRPGS